MTRISRYLTVFGPTALMGDPTSLTILAVAGVCALGIYAYDRYQKSAAK